MTTAQEKHTAWLAAEIQAAIDDPRPSIPPAEAEIRFYSELETIKLAHRTQTKMPPENPGRFTFRPEIVWDVSHTKKFNGLRAREWYQFNWDSTAGA